MFGTFQWKISIIQCCNSQVLGPYLLPNRKRMLYAISKVVWLNWDLSIHFSKWETDRGLNICGDVTGRTVAVNTTSSMLCVNLSWTSLRTSDSNFCMHPFIHFFLSFLQRASCICKVHGSEECNYSFGYDDICTGVFIFLLLVLYYTLRGNFFLNVSSKKSVFTKKLNVWKCRLKRYPHLLFVLSYWRQLKLRSSNGLLWCCLDFFCFLHLVFFATEYVTSFCTLVCLYI